MTRPAAVLAAAALLAGAAAGTAHAAALTLSAATLGTAAPAVPVMYPVSLVLEDKNANDGKVENNDTVTLVLAGQVDLPTLCSSWSNGPATQTATVRWSIVDGGSGNDVLRPTDTSGTCAGGLLAGSIDLGSAGYDTSTSPIEFTAAKNDVTVGATTTTLVVILKGATGGTAGTVTSGTRAVWTPDPGLKDRSGRTCGANVAATSAVTQF